MTKGALLFSVLSAIWAVIGVAQIIMGRHGDTSGDHAVVMSMLSLVAAKVWSRGL